VRVLVVNKTLAGADERNVLDLLVRERAGVLVVNKTLAGADERNVLDLLVRERAQSCM
jgi:hypothetical protein